MVELPEPSVTMLPDKPEPEATADVAGAVPALKGMVWASTGELSPSAAGVALRPLEGGLATSFKSVVLVEAVVVVLLVLTVLLVSVPIRPPRVRPLAAAVVPPAAPL